MRQQPVVQNGPFTLGPFAVVGIALILLLVAHQVVHQLSLLLWRRRGDDSPVGLLHLLGLKHRVQSAQRLAGLGKNHKTAYGAVQAVGYTDKDIAGFVVLHLQVALEAF